MRKIKNDSEYNRVMVEIDNLFDCEPNSDEWERLEYLETIAEQYEIDRLGFQDSIITRDILDI